MTDPLTKLSNYLLEHSKGIDTCWTAKVIEEARKEQARNLEAELLTALLETLATELNCGHNAHEIRQAISSLKHAPSPSESEAPLRRYLRCRRCGYTYEGYSAKPPAECPNRKCGSLEEYVDGVWAPVSAPTTLKNELPEKIVGAQREWFSSDTRKGEVSAPAPTPTRYRPDPDSVYLCCYCNGRVKLREPDSVVDSYMNVCHYLCLKRAEGVVASEVQPTPYQVEEKKC